MDNHINVLSIQRIIRLNLLALAALLITACGGGSSSNQTSTTPSGSTGDTIAPIVTFTPSTLSVLSSTTASTNLTATDNVGVTTGPTTTCTNGGLFSDNIFTAPNVTEVTTIVCTATASDAAKNTQTAELTVTVRPPAKPKNIIYIMLDDADFNDFGFNNSTIENPDAVTPNMNALRMDGMLLTRFYSGAPICSPSRTSLLTGQNSIKMGFRHAVPEYVGQRSQVYPAFSGIPNNIPHLGKTMQDAGKATAHIGKWHVGSYLDQYRPNAMGFDEYARLLRIEAPAERWDGEYSLETETDVITGRTDYLDREFLKMAINFIERNAAHPDGFFLNLSLFTPHFPFSPPLGYENIHGFNLSTDRGKLLAMMHSVDEEIGRITDTLQMLGIKDDTLIILTSDNGGVNRARHPEAYLKGTKGTWLEGGVRVSAIASWVNGIQAGTLNESVITMMDVFPTLSDLIGVPPVIGKSKASALRENAIIPHDPIFGAIDGRSLNRDGEADMTYSLLDNNHRIVKLEGRSPDSENAYALYDLVNDPRGQNNIALSEPQLLSTMIEKLDLARRDKSRLDIIPSSVESITVLPFDPRYDVTQKSMTFEMTIDVPTPSMEATPLIRNEAYDLVLNANNSISWIINGVTELSGVQQFNLTSAPLFEGQHDIKLYVLGYKSDHSVVKLFVDGVEVASEDLVYAFATVTDQQATPRDMLIGNDKVLMTNINYYQTGFED